MDSKLESILRQANIDEVDRNNLFTLHGVTNYETLKEKRDALENLNLNQVTTKSQTKLALVLGYLEVTRRSNEDPLPNFDRKDWLEFCAKQYYGLDTGLEQGGDDGDDDVDDDNGNGTSLTRNLAKLSVTPKEKKASIPTAPEESKPAELGKFEMLDQHFVPSDEWIPPDIDDDMEEEKVEPLKLLYVDFQGRRFYKGRCYKATSAKGHDIIVGIKGFRSEIEAYCVRIIHAKDTFLGNGDDAEDFFDALKKHNPTLYMQVSGTQRVKLSEMGKACSGDENEPKKLPELIYEPRLPGRSRTFGYMRDVGSMKTAQLARKEFRMVEAFSGAGGMHLGYKEEGFTTACAVEVNPAAVATFKLNNPGVRVFEYDGVANPLAGNHSKDELKGDIRKFIANYDPEEMGQVSVIHTSSPCQGFSRANRYGGKNDEVNNQLSYTFFDLLRVTGALVGVFENVDGMWMAKNISYLRKILVETIALGYQVRVQVLRACDYGDPQARPRLIIFAAKNFVKMPERPHRTHGFSAYNPITTTKKALDFLLSPEAKAMNFPNSEPAPVNHYDPSKKDDELLEAHKLAPAVLATGGRVFHYAEDRMLTVRELATLQSFPLDYKFLGSRPQQIKQAGNAVPVEFARAIARSVRDSLRLLYVEELVPSTESTNDDDDLDEEVEDFVEAAEENGELLGEPNVNQVSATESSSTGSENNDENLIDLTTSDEEVTDPTTTEPSIESTTESSTEDNSEEDIQQKTVNMEDDDGGDDDMVAPANPSSLDSNGQVSISGGDEENGASKEDDTAAAMDVEPAAGDGGGMTAGSEDVEMAVTKKDKEDPPGAAPSISMNTYLNEDVDIPSEFLLEI